MSLLVYVASDAAPFEESKHPRDNAGKFATTSGGGGNATAPSGGAGGQSSGPTAVHTKISKVMKAGGFQKLKGATAYQSPSTGESLDVDWNTGAWKSSTGKSGGLETFKAHLKGAALANQQATMPAYMAPKMTPTQQGAASAVSEKAIAKGYKPAGEMGGKQIFAKPDGKGKFEVNYQTGEWVSETPGFPTKEGTTLEGLQALIDGKTTASFGGNPPWKNSSKQVAQTPEQAAAAEKAKAEAAAQVEKTKAEAAAKAKALKEAQEKATSQYGLAKSWAPEPTTAERNAISATADRVTAISTPNCGTTPTPRNRIRRSKRSTPIWRKPRRKRT